MSYQERKGENGIAGARKKEGKKRVNEKEGGKKEGRKKHPNHQ